MRDAQVAALEERYQVVRYNIRGHGYSPVPDGPYSIDDSANDLVALLDRLGIGRTHLVGLSLGGMTAMRVAARKPERVDRLVLLCTGAQLPPASGWTDRATTVRRRQRRRRQGGRRALVHSRVPRGPSRRQGTHEAMVAATPAEGCAGCCEAIAALDLRGDLASINAPTLAIAGADDPATPPATKLLVVPRAAHLANAQQPATITPALIEHLEQT